MTWPVIAPAVVAAAAILALVVRICVSGRHAGAVNIAVVICDAPAPLAVLRIAGQGAGVNADPRSAGATGIVNKAITI